MKKLSAIKTKRLILTPMSGDEMAALIAAETDGHLRAAYGEMLRLSREHPESADWYACWRIDRRDGQRVGSFCFKGPPENGGVEIGYGIDEAYRRQGFAAEAVSAAVDWALGHDDVQFVLAETAGDNAASQALLRKIGFVPDGEGEEGPRFKKARPAMSWVPIGMCFGVALGTALGNILSNLALWLALGICFGMMFGLLMDSSLKNAEENTEDDRK